LSKHSSIDSLLLMYNTLKYIHTYIHIYIYFISNI